MPPFEHGHTQPFYRNSPPTNTLPMTPTRGFPPIFPRMPAQPPPAPAPLPASQGTGGLGGFIASFLSQNTAGTTGNLNLPGIITNAQKAIQTAQTVLPMIQQFGPLVKNAPAILSALKGMQGETEKTEKDKSDTTEKTNSSAASDKNSDNHSDSSVHSSEKINNKNTKSEQSASGSSKNNISDSLLNSDRLPTKPSVPRMYI
ncbi:YqfQ family protein [Sporolactobacillus shoreicorticis]|uniref:YqfQ family protein n=1 Tax=Sporolactobacillus shoreicorticis TaxID=1923877 RepID=A0ABW5S5E0_9BACL|nr:YqfQ family protein [Sporolactobacillus shoreicorticis]MCO7126315.1 YqfQ family protein [Sporolactobacillus shoreicorticis]